MSVEAIFWAFKQDIDDPAAKLVLLAMADSSNTDHGGTWISCQTIIKKTSLGERTVRRKINYLEKEEKITRSTRLRGNGSQTTNFYHLACFEKPDLAKLAPPPCQSDTPSPPANLAKTSYLAPPDPDSHHSRLSSNGAVSQEDSLFPELQPVESLSRAREVKKRNFGPSEEIIAEFFERFWKKYPHKVGVAVAEKEFRKIFKEQLVTMEVLMAGLDRYIRTKPADRAWCNPSTWLHQHRWTDQPAKANSYANSSLDYVMGRGL